MGQGQQQQQQQLGEFSSGRIEPWIRAFTLLASPFNEEQQQQQHALRDLRYAHLERPRIRSASPASFTFFTFFGACLSSSSRSPHSDQPTNQPTNGGCTPPLSTVELRRESRARQRQRQRQRSHAGQRCDVTVLGCSGVRKGAARGWDTDRRPLLLLLVPVPMPVLMLVVLPPEMLPIEYQWWYRNHCR